MKDKISHARSVVSCSWIKPMQQHYHPLFLCLYFDRSRHFCVKSKGFHIPANMNKNRVSHRMRILIASILSKGKRKFVSDVLKNGMVCRTVINIEHILSGFVKLLLVSQELATTYDSHKRVCSDRLHLELKN